LKFLKNYWYVAAWGHEIKPRPLGRTILNEPVVFFRKKDGAVVALADRCSHRAYPLHKGRLIEDTLECGYHGVTFDCSGRCIRVPGQAQVPVGADVQSYPIVERWGLVWIWMGESSLAKPASVTDWPLLDHPDWDARGGRLEVNCNYQLIIDNLLDLSHVTYVHPRTIGSTVKLEEIQIKNEIKEDSITISRSSIDVKPPPTYARVGFKGNVDRWQIINFQPPAFVGGIGLHTFNAMTPETEKKTHYYWALAQTRAPETENLTDSIFLDFQKTIEEDVEVFEEQQRSLDLKPDAPMMTIRSDVGPIAARRMIERLQQAEANGA
jgi:phenylpropionate dioxygenase-like ring-hydroxylating dioxygenase large terminal subunit